MYMTNVFLIIELIVTFIMGVYFFTALKNQGSSKVVVKLESKKEMDKLRKLKSISLTAPLSEISRPKNFDEVVGQEKAINALKAAICGPNPQHVIIYGPPGVGKTAAARLVLEEAKKRRYSPFKKDAKFIEIDATTVRTDERGIADPLIGSVHDPIYQGAGPLGISGIPQPKPGAVTKAHGGILFIDEIGELHPNEMNKLLKVMEDRKVFFESAYYNSEDSNIPAYIKDVFENGLPADFRLIGATTRSPNEIIPALRSRCMEIFFKSLSDDEIQLIAKRAAQKIKVDIDDEALKLIGKYTSNGRDAVNLVQMSYGIVLNENKKKISASEVEMVIESGRYNMRLEMHVGDNPQVGLVNGLAVYGADIGTLMQIEASALENNYNNGKVVITGIVDEEEIDRNGSRIKRKSMIKCSVENVISVLKKLYNFDEKKYDIHLNFPGGIPVDGPSAGISIACVIYSAVNNLYIDNETAMTGEISIQGLVKPVGGISAKISAAIKAGAKRIIVPYENYEKKFLSIKGAEIIPVKRIDEVFKIAFIENSKIIVNNKIDVLTAKSL